MGLRGKNKRWRPSPGFSCLWRDYWKKKIRLKNKGKIECLCERNIEIWKAETNTQGWRDNDCISSIYVETIK